jgi:hypothetical protein
VKRAARGIAVELAAGATVYVTGRTNRKQQSESARPEQTILHPLKQKGSFAVGSNPNGTFSGDQQNDYR